MQKPFDWKRSRVYSWKSGFLPGEVSDAGRAPGEATPTTKKTKLAPPKSKKS